MISLTISEKHIRMLSDRSNGRGAVRANEGTHPNACEDVAEDAFAKVAAFFLACGCAVQGLDQAEGVVELPGGVSVHAALEVCEACPIVCPSGKWVTREV